MVVGNSVARTANFTTSRTFISGLEHLYPNNDFSFEYGEVKLENNKLNVNQNRFEVVAGGTFNLIHNDSHSFIGS